MDRRDFLLLRTDARKKVAELSLERLYMRFVDAQLSGADAADSAGEAESERAPVFAQRSANQLFERLAQDLSEVDVLHLNDRAWLDRDDFRRAVEPVLRAFAAHGEIR